MKYTIKYYFDGEGQTIIEAKNKEEAEDKFYNGDYGEEDDIEEGTNYQIHEILDKKGNNVF